MSHNFLFTALTWYNNVFVVSHEILENSKRRSLYVDVTPVDPAVRRAQSGTQEPVTRLSHRLTATGLCREAVSGLDVLVDFLSKVLLHNRDLAELLLRVWIGLQLLQLLRQDSDCLILGISDQECQIDKIVRVGKVPQMAEEHVEMGRGVSQRSADEYALLALPSPCGSLHIVEIVISHGFELRVVARCNEAERARAQVRSQAGEEEEQACEEERCSQQQALY